MENRLRTRFFKYLVDHYERMPESKIVELIEEAKIRIAKTGYFSKEVLESVINEMKEENVGISNILAHLDLLDIEDRT